MRRGIFVAALLAAMPSCLVHAQGQPPNQAPDQMQDELQGELQSAAPDQMQGQMQERNQLQTAPDQAQNPAQPEGHSQPSAIAYRGTSICERAPGSVVILKVPADLAIRGDQVQFARPLLNPRGTR